MLYHLLSLCDNRYINNAHLCSSCQYGTNCPKDCGKCLEFVHYPNRAPAPRTYDCQKMMDFYFCKYACKYASEMYYALDACVDAKPKKQLEVLSFGCGPCTELLALHELQKRGNYKFTSINYNGVDIDLGIWQNIHDDINTIIPCGYNCNFIPSDACNYINTLFSNTGHPDIIILNYVLSDMNKHNTQQTMNNFITNLAIYMASCPINTYLICNDINLTRQSGGAREYYDDLLKNLKCKKDYIKAHFQNDKAPCFVYGEQYSHNHLAFNLPKFKGNYVPYLSCSSAQIIIKKV